MNLWGVGMGLFTDILDNVYKCLTGEDINYVNNAKVLDNSTLNKDIDIDFDLINPKEIKSNLPWQKYESIYSYILSNCNKDEFKYGISKLPEDSDESNNMWGNITTLENSDEEFFNFDTILVESIADNLIKCCNLQSEENYINLYNSLINTNIILVMDSIIDLIVDRQEEITIENLYILGLWLCRDSCHRNAVIFGIALLGRVRLEDDIIEVLGKCKDFIYPLCFAILIQGKECNNKLFKLASVSNGWDRIQILEYIKPETEYEKRWFITKGLKCSIKCPKLASICAQKCHLEEKIDDYLSVAMTREGLSKLITYFLDESDYSEFLNYKYNKGLLKKFVYYFRDMKLFKDEKKAFKKIYTFITKCNLEMEYIDVYDIVKSKLSAQQII